MNEKIVTPFQKMVNFFKGIFQDKGKYFVSSLQANSLKKVNVVVKQLQLLQ